MAPLAWQSSSAMSANGGANTGTDIPASNQGPAQGTEYTLQGVMRFLQMEWHRHERERNGWDIERAEMKGRIAKLEGDHRSNKKLQDSLSHHIKLLENALKREREKSKTASATEEATPGAKSGSSTRKTDNPPAPVEAARDSKPPARPHNSFLDVSESASRDDPQRSKMRGHLDKAILEATYLLTPPPQPPPQGGHPASHELAVVHGYAGPGDPIPILADVSLQPARHSNIHRSDNPSNRPLPSWNYQIPPVDVVMATDPGDQSDLVNRPPPSQQQQQQHQQQQQQQLLLLPPQQMSRPQLEQPFVPSSEPYLPMEANHRVHLQPSIHFPAAATEQANRATSRTYDVSARPSVTVSEETNATANPAPETRPAADSDAWDFDEPAQTPYPTPASAIIPPPPPPPLAAMESTWSRGLDVDRFPKPNQVARSPPRTGFSFHRRKGSMSRRRSDEAQGIKKESLSPSQGHLRADTTDFKVRFALRGHLDVVRAVIFTGGGSPSEPEICTTGDDGVLKRWIIPASYSNFGAPTGDHNDLDVVSYFTHRGHTGAVTSLSACPSSQNFLTGGRALGDGWVFSGGQDATVRVWERGRVDAKATLIGHTDAVWNVCVLPATTSSIFGGDNSSGGGGGGGVGSNSGNHGGDRILVASGAADGTIKIWAVSAPPQSSSSSLAHSGSRRGVGGSRRHSVTSGSGFPSSPQPSTATSTPFHHTLVHTIVRPGVNASPTCIAPSSATGNTFVAAYMDAAVIIFDTRTGEEVVGMASLETYDGTAATGANTVVATTGALEGISSSHDSSSRGISDDEGRVHGATGSSGGVEGVVISGHEDRYIRFFDANSGQCTYNMLAHPAAISSLSLSPDGRELVSAGHDASLRFWSLEKRSCTQEMTSHRLMRGEGVCAVVWSQDGRWVVSGGGDGVVKVFSR